MRRGNLSRVLRLVHQSGALTRSELTRITGLNRSTIAALVAELRMRGLVEENDSVRTQGVGRPSPVVEVSERTVVIAIVPEADAIVISLVGMGGRVLRRVRCANERVPSAAEFVNVASAVIAGMRPELEASFRVLGIGVALPGLVSSADGRVIMAPRLGWRDVALADMLQASTGLSAIVGNDASCGTGAETIFGAERGQGLVVYLNGGASGIGGGIALDGTVLTGALGTAGEFGHTLVESQGHVCDCGAIGCLQTEVSRARLLKALGLRQEEADRLQAMIVRAWAGGASAAREEIERQVGYLGIAVRTVVNTLNPSRIVLGGFLALMLDAVGDAQVREAADPSLPETLSVVQIVAASRPEDILMIGAAEQVFAAVLEDPLSLAVLEPA